MADQICEFRVGQAVTCSCSICVKHGANEVLMKIRQIKEQFWMFFKAVC